MKQNTPSQGAVIWITGFSAAGKTTVGRQVSRMLSEDGLPALFLDGDQLRSIFAHKWGYSREDRVELSCTYFRLCSHLSKQGAVVVIAAVSMFDEVREWFEANVENGFVAYLRVPLDERITRDERTKGLYKAKSGLASMGDYTEPERPDAVIDNHGDVDADTASRLVVEAFRRQRHTSVDYGRSDHWAEFYRRAPVKTTPSPFAEYCATRLEPGQRLLEVGCGNGRDATYFADRGFAVSAVDRSEAAIEACVANMGGRAIEYVCADAAELADRFDPGFGVVYSRFSLHAMTRVEEERMLAGAAALLAPGGQLCVECRSINDPLARQGEVLSPSERVAGHYRRFIVLDELLASLDRLGFDILEQVESRGLAVHGDEDPVVIRVLASRRA